jgi:uncharacterized membrane protein
MTDSDKASRTPGAFFGAKKIGLTKREDVHEADLVATWFARVGALALLVGAGFGYRYAVDRGLIGPGGRVALGVLVALVLIALGERTAARGWRPFAQAAAGGGTGLLYVTTWAAFHQYGLIDARVSFVLLGAVAVGGALLALRHDSQALAVLATLGAFANPVVVGGESLGTAASLGYILMVDLCVLGLSYSRRWEVLNWVAAASSWALFVGHARDVPTIGAISFVSAYQLIFATTTVANGVRAVRGTNPVPPAQAHLTDLRNSLFFAFNACVHLVAVMALMTPELSHRRGAVLGVVGALYLALALGLWKKGVRGIFLSTVAVTGAALAIVWAPIQLDVQWVPGVWAAEAAVALFVGYAVRSSNVRLAGSILMMTSVAMTIVMVGDGETYASSEIFLSWHPLGYAMHAVSVFAGAFALVRYGEVDDERQAGAVFVALANALTLVYASLVASAYVDRNAAVPARHQLIQFALTALWATYACVLVAIGVARAKRLLRYLGVGLFGATFVKIVVSDVWLLDTGYRTLVFVGLGVLLLGCSLMYSRFKDVLLEGRAPTASGGGDDPSSPSPA